MTVAVERDIYIELVLSAEDGKLRYRTEDGLVELPTGGGALPAWISEVYRSLGLATDDAGDFSIVADPDQFGEVWIQASPTPGEFATIAVRHGPNQVRLATSDDDNTIQNTVIVPEPSADEPTSGALSVNGHGFYMVDDVPNAALGAVGNWALSNNGHIYYKSGSGGWLEKV